MAETTAKRIRVSSKRQITIPMKFHQLLGMSDEVDCHVRNGALIITPIRPEPTGEFAEEILAAAGEETEAARTEIQESNA